MGYVHVYTGNGKGKTTAALGLALRAICAGKKVYIGQFIKGMHYSELEAVKYLPNLLIEQYGRGCFIRGKPTEEDVKLAHTGLKRVREILESNAFDIVILDEINVALFYRLLDVSEVLELIANRPHDVELILTGRYAPKEIIEVADLVTEMVEVKHYYQQGVVARKGIEF
ncbi:cob(I)yrinic acid a,c-diamide adenosyltransferase [Fervidobacterium thailandense]|uniref:Cob(I)yrinic acid a,c-diamide adenosyltransferase n=1 Tax=Fervidobacterium thailandense TaxID=1008305 RepID=A0A1E3G3Y4_9BACT|nr:cob(I)yrinic acid a,c-diamide adenosyltransferase [Fervidobacterium thailandense]ODN30523.1 cob(I)yrinic acid a,c-diamide adenosyltransferase [Fervidobacterium thailandense]